jgi:hypothetical protein
MRDGSKLLPLTDELVDFVESGVSILLATRDANLRPHGVRAMGALVSPDRHRITLYVPSVVAEKALENLRANGAIAATFVRPSDAQGLQFKGRFVAERPATDNERHLQERYRAAFFEQLFFCGVARTTSKRYAYWPSIAVEFEPDSLFKQTPGPGAGAAIGAAT